MGLVLAGLGWKWACTGAGLGEIQGNCVGQSWGRLDQTGVSSLHLEVGVLGSPGVRPGTPVLTAVLAGPHTEHLLVSTPTAVPGWLCQETEAGGTQTK